MASAETGPGQPPGRGPSQAPTRVPAQPPNAPVATVGDPPVAAVGTFLRSPVPWVVWGLAMAAMAAGVGRWDWPPTGGDIVGLALCSVGAVAASIPYTGRQVVISTRIHHNLVIHRNTLLPVGFVFLVASGHPPRIWEVAVDSALLAGYLLMLDAVTVPAPVLRRLAHPGFLLAAAALTAAATVLVALPGSASALRGVVVAIAAVAVLSVALATGFRAGDTRRVGSARTPQTDPKK